MVLSAQCHPEVKFFIFKKFGYFDSNLGSPITHKMIISVLKDLSDKCVATVLVAIKVFLINKACFDERLAIPYLNLVLSS